MNRLGPLLRTPLLGFGLGALAGGFEAVAVAATLDLALTWSDAFALAGSVVGLAGTVGLLLGVPAGVAVAIGTRSWFPPRRYAAGMALTAVFLGCWYLWPLGLYKAEQGLLPAGIAFGLTPIGIGGVTWFNALYWFRREDLGERRRIGWWAIGPLAGLCIAAVGAWMMADRAWGGSRALADDPLVVVVAVEGLRADAAPGAVAGSPTLDTPSIDALAEHGLVFTNAVSPVPDAAAAQAALLTGRHPVRCGLVGDGDKLLRGYDSVAEIFREEGYATGAFVSTTSLSGRGLNQGFAVFDAEPPLPLRGLSRVTVVSWGLSLMRSFAPESLSSLERRSDAETANQALSWLDAVGDRPALLWVTLSGPTGAAPADYLASVAAADAQVGRIVEGVQAHAGGRPLVLIVVGATGRDLGEHGDPAGAATLWDGAVRVPLVVVPQGLRGVKFREVGLQVRLMDVPATLLALVGLDEMEDSEGADLLGFAQGTRVRHYASLLAVRAGSSLGPGQDGLLLGYRAARSGEDGNVKFLLDPATGQHQLFDLVDDPAESADLSAAQPDAVAAVEQQVRKEAANLLRSR
jgi:hypothetical protein